MMRTTAPVAIVVIGMLGCNEIGGINEPLPRGPTTPGGVVGVDAGAPSGDSKLAPFLGSWSSNNGAVTLRCPGEPEQTGTLPSDIVLEPGRSSDLELKELACALKLNVNGNKATLVGGQTCTHTDAQERDDYTFADGSFVLGTPTGTATLTLRGKVKITTTSGSGTCDFERADPFVRQQQ